MVEWYKNLYMDEITKHAEKQIKKLTQREKIQYPVFFVTIATNEANLLDIINANELLFPYYKRQKVFVLGIASSRQQAKIMAAAIVTKLYQETGDFRVRDWFCRSDEGKENFSMTSGNRV